MVNLLPAVLIGGPPHAGKSVLFYSLTQALRVQGVRHHAIRACPDGEGNWSQEIDQDSVRLIRVKGEWTDEFVERISRDIEHRLLPMLIDMGGYPQGKQIQILRHCTHSILLLRPEDEDSALFWSRLIEENGVLPLARLHSERKGRTTVDERIPVITGTLAGLERGTLAHGPLFDVLVERVASLFSSYSVDGLEKASLDQAPTELVINLPLSLEMLAPGAKRWQPAMLSSLLNSLPPDTALSVYGQGPLWIYGALAAYTERQPFYQFDPRLGASGMGWVAPPPLRLSLELSPEIGVQLRQYNGVTVLSVEIVKKHLDYLQAEMLPFPPIPVENGLILDGSMPSWLLTALVRAYTMAGVAWVACHYPQLKSAIVVFSRESIHRPGSAVAMPAS